MADRHDGDVIIDGGLSVAGPVNLSSSANVPANALKHQHRKDYAQSGAATPATVFVHECRGTSGTIRSFRAGSIVACGGVATVTLDLKKNGVSVLSAVITLDVANAARVAEAGTLVTTTLSQGDVLELVVVATAGGGTLATGLFAETIVDEDYA